MAPPTPRNQYGTEWAEDGVRCTTQSEKDGEKKGKNEMKEKVTKT